VDKLKSRADPEVWEEPEERDPMERFSLRVAVDADVDALTALIDASVRGLQANDYTPRQIEAALGRVFGVDRQLIADRTYFVVDFEGRLVAGGGWSFRRTLYGADAADVRDDAVLNPTFEPARIRAFFVDPEFARRGLGSLVLNACEQAALKAGFSRTELGATLTGMPLYARHGYEEIERTLAPLPDGASLAIVRMGKTFPTPDASAA